MHAPARAMDDTAVMMERCSSSSAGPHSCAASGSALQSFSAPASLVLPAWWHQQ